MKSVSRMADLGLFLATEALCTEAAQCKNVCLVSYLGVLPQKPSVDIKQCCVNGQGSETFQRYVCLGHGQTGLS